MKKLFSLVLAFMAVVAVSAKELAVLADYSAAPVVVTGWGNQPFFLSDAGVELAAAGAEAGQKVRFHIASANPEWQMQILEGHWGPQYAFFGDAAIDPDTLAAKGITGVDLAETPYVELELTQAMIDAAMTQQWWGGTFLANGDGNINITKITLNDDITVLEDVTLLADYSAAPVVVTGWGNQPFFLSDAGLELAAAGAEEEDIVRFHIASADAEWQMQILEGHWGPQYAFFGDAAIDPDTLAAKGITGVDLSKTPYVDLRLTQAMIDAAMTQQWWGGTFLANGDGNIQITKIELVRQREVIISETVLAKYAEPVVVTGWGNQPFFLSDAGVELAEAGAEAGQKVRFYIASANPEWQMQILEGHWGPQYAFFGDAAIDPDTLAAKGITGVDLSKTPYVELELTQAMIDAAMTQQWWGGTFLANGDGNINITKITLYNEQAATVDTIYAHLVEVVTPFVEYGGGEEVLPELIVYNADSTKVLKENSDYTVEYKNNINLGRALGTITGKKRYTGTVAFSYNIVAKEAEASMVTISDSVAIYDKPAVPELTIAYGKETLEEGTDYEVTYTNNDAVGTANYSIEFSGKYYGTLEGTFEVVAPKTLTNANVLLEAASFEYTMQAIEPAVTVVYGGDTLVAGTDYTVEYADNIELTVSAGIKVTAMGYYTGTVDTVFAIVPRIITNEMVELEAYRFLATGAAIEPIVTAQYADHVLVELDEYNVVYANNVEASTNATATVTFKGNYAGVVVKTFEIYNPMTEGAVTASLSETTYTYNGGEQKPEVRVADSLGYTLKEGTDYAVAYPEDVTNAGNDTVVVSLKGIYSGEIKLGYKILPLTADSVNIEVEATVLYINDTTEVKAAVKATFGGNELAADKDYTLTYGNNKVVSDTAYVQLAFMGNFKDTVVRNFTIVAPDTLKNIAKLEKDTIEYHAAGNNAKVIVNYLDSVRVEEKEYTVAYYNTGAVTNDSVKAYAVVTYMGYLTGVDTLYYSIVPQVVADSLVSFETNEVEWYKNDSVSPILNAIKDGEYALVYGKDFDIAVANCQKVGDKGEMTVTFQGNYAGEVKLAYDVVARKFNAETFSVLTITDTVYMAAEIKPAVAISFADTTLAADADFVVTYANNVEPGEAAIYVAFQGNYAGVDTITFTIAPRQLTTDMVTIEGVYYQYTGNEIKPAVTSVVDPVLNYSLVEGVDYEVSYLNNIYGGYGSVIVTGKNHYAGRARMTFYIDGPDALNDIEAEQTVKKIFINDRVYIIRDQKMYDVVGRLVK